jgi:L-threonylcarbamoyladenylate synthase
MVKSTTNLELQTKINKNKIKAPGLLESHYSPKAKIILDKIAKAGEGFIAMSNIPTPIGAIRLASPKTNEEYAKALYSSLRLADQNNIDTIAIILPDSIGIGDAVRDRLTKAANVN